MPPKLAIRPLIPDLWAAFEDLFGPRGACNGCWCMYWRIGSAYRREGAERNKAGFEQVVRQGPPPGLLGFEWNLAVEWCQLAPRDALGWLASNKWLPRVDDAPVWTNSCFYIRKGYRRKGITTALISAAIRVARQARAPALEAYRLDAALAHRHRHRYASTFERAGFKFVARPTSARPIMRLELSPKQNKTH